MGCREEVNDVPAVYFDVFNLIGESLVHGVHQCERGINRNSVIHPVTGIAIAPDYHIEKINIAVIACSEQTMKRTTD